MKSMVCICGHALSTDGSGQSSRVKESHRTPSYHRDSSRVEDLGFRLRERNGRVSRRFEQITRCDSFQLLIRSEIDPALFERGVEVGKDTSKVPDTRSVTIVEGSDPTGSVSFSSWSVKSRVDCKPSKH